MAQVAKIQYEQRIMEKESEKKIADIEVLMHVNKEKSLADAAFYKALKEAESDKVDGIHFFQIAKISKLFFRVQGEIDP